MECEVREKTQWCRIIRCEECPHCQLSLEERIAPLSTDGRAWDDSMRNSVIYPSRELIEQMKRDYPKWRSQMFGVPDMSDDKMKE